MQVLVLKSESDLGKLEELERFIRRGMESLPEMGAALKTIQEEKLYRVRGYKSFESYLGEHWPDLSRRRAYQLIDFAGVAENVNHGTQPVPLTCERHARELANLPPTAQREVWAAATDGGTEVTAERLAFLAQKSGKGLLPLPPAREPLPKEETTAEREYRETQESEAAILDRQKVLEDWRKLDRLANRIDKNIKEAKEIHLPAMANIVNLLQQAVDAVRREAETG